MRKVYWILLACALLLPLLAAAQSPFDGTWKVDMSKVDWPSKPDVYLLQNGMYQCKTCSPPIKVKADGTDQQVTGHPYYNTIAIKVVSDHEIEETDKKDGKTVATSRMMVSPDGNTLTFQFNDSSNTNAAPVTGKGEATRVAKGPAGSNAISGSWRTTKMENISENGITWNYKVNGDELTMTTPTGQSYTAKMDGTEAPMKGDPGVTAVSVKKMGDNTIEETDKRAGKVIGVMKATVGPDGKTMNLSYDDELVTRTTSYTATKQ
ncbi:MAG TPA: hypothetical protein VL240_05505 [Candidatus Binatia bacterium]|nr:hypothetical protein [Candidatus Binatia bacterium]